MAKIVIKTVPTLKYDTTSNVLLTRILTKSKIGRKRDLKSLAKKRKLNLHYSQQLQLQQYQQKLQFTLRILRHVFRFKIESIF